MTHTMLRLSAIGCVAATIFAASVNLQAQTVLYEDGFARGIQNLRLNNACYDVEFVDGSYQTTFATSSPTFLNEPAEANAAANAIRDILNDTRRVPEINSSANEVLWIPNERSTRSKFRASQVGHDKSADPWRRFADFAGDVGLDKDAWEFATFQQGPTVIYAANTGYAVGIHNLNIDGTCLDVRFADGSYEEVFADHTPRYLGQEGGANQATNSIASVLNGEKAVPEINASDNEVLWIPSDRSKPTFEAEQVGHDSSAAPWKRFGDFQGTVATNFAAWDFAVFDESLDCNRDGVVDVLDMNCVCASGDAKLGEAILHAIDSLVGDLDGDGSVEFADFLQLTNHFGGKGEYTDGDLNCDGLIGFADFLALAENYGNGGNASATTTIASVPEPASYLLWATVLPAALAMRRRR